MNMPARTAAVLRQPPLAHDARVPGRGSPLADPAHRELPGTVADKGQRDAARQAEANSPNVGANGEPSAPMDAAAVEAEIERRAAIAAEAMIERQRGEWLALAREQGFAEGVRNGREAAERDWQALAARAQTLLDAVKQEAARERQTSAELALHLTFVSLRKLLGEAFASKAGAQAAIANVLAQTEAHSVEVIRMAPRDVALLAGTGAGDGLFGALPKEVALEADERIAPGGCVIETRRGALDGRIESQLERLLDAIRQAYAAREASEDKRGDGP